MTRLVLLRGVDTPAARCQGARLGAGILVDDPELDLAAATKVTEHRRLLRLRHWLHHRT